MARTRNCINRSTSEPVSLDIDFTTYSTENPLSNSGMFINGKTLGLDWNDVAVQNGLGAYGTQIGEASPNYDDSVAIIVHPTGGVWPTTLVDMRAQINSINQKTTGGHNQEIELWPIANGAAHIWAGYEFSWRCTTSGQYASIVRWNGAVTSFNVLVNAVSPPGIPSGQSQIRAVKNGSVLSAYQRAGTTALSDDTGWGSAVMTYNIASGTPVDGLATPRYSVGGPSIAFWNRNEPGTNKDFVIEKLRVRAS